MRQFLACLALLPLAACTVAQSDATAAEPVLTACRGESLGKFVGQQASQELGGRMLAASGTRTIRWVPEGGMVTMDYQAQRLTVHLDGANRVERASCG